MIAKLLKEKVLLELYVKKIQDINKNKNNFKEFLNKEKINGSINGC